MMRLIRILLSNLLSVVLSLILALLIWLNASQAEDPLQDRWLQIGIDYVGQPNDSILLSAERQNTQVFFEGPASVLTEMTSSDFTAVVDLSQVPFGSETLVDVRVQVNNPEVTLLSQPEPVPVLLEQLVSKDVPVELDIRGVVARGHVQGDPLIDPQFITVSGPASRVDTLDRARATINLNNDRETRVDTSQPIFYDLQGSVASVSGLNLSTDVVEVTIPVNEAANYAEKFISIDLIGVPAPGYRLLSAKTQPQSVLIQGSPTQLSALTQVRTEEVDITGLTESFSQQVALVLPEGVTLDEVVEINVDVEIEPFLTTRPYNQTVIMQGLAENLEASAEPDTVRVVLFGPLPALETLLAEEVRVTIDLFGLDEGVYRLEPAVDIPDRGIEVRSVQPAQVTVSVTSIFTDGITNTLGLTETFTISDTSALLAPDSSVGNPGAGTVAQVFLPLSAFPAIHLPGRFST